MPRIRTWLPVWEGISVEANLQRSSHVLTGMNLIARLYQAGLVPEGCRRVVIDAPANGLAVLMYEVYLGEEKFKVDMLAGIRVEG